MAGPLRRLHDRPCPSLTILPVTVSHLGLCMLGCRAWHHGSSNSTQRSGESLQRSHTWSTRCWDLLASLHFPCAAGRLKFTTSVSDGSVSKQMQRTSSGENPTCTMSVMRPWTSDVEMPSPSLLRGWQPTWWGRSFCDQAKPLFLRRARILSIMLTSFSPPFAFSNSAMISAFSSAEIAMAGTFRCYTFKSEPNFCSRQMRVYSASRDAIKDLHPSTAIWLRDLSGTWITIATEGIYDQVKPLKIFGQINFPKAPLVRRRLHRPTHAHHRRSGRTNIQENDDSKEKSLHSLRYTKKVPPNHIRFVLCFFGSALLIMLYFARCMGWKISEPRWFNFKTWLKSLFSHQDTPKNKRNRFQKNIFVFHGLCSFTRWAASQTQIGTWKNKTSYTKIEKHHAPKW